MLLSSRVDGLESEIDVISGKLDNFATKDELNTVKDQLTVMLETAVSELNQTIAGINTRLDGLDTLVGNLQGTSPIFRQSLAILQPNSAQLSKISQHLLRMLLMPRLKQLKLSPKQSLMKMQSLLLIPRWVNLSRSSMIITPKERSTASKPNLKIKITALNTALDALGTELRGAINNVETALGLAEGRLDAIEEFNNKVEKQFSFLWDKLARLITSIQLQRVVNPIFGGLDFPIGFSTSVLANYLYNGVNDVTFPNDDSKLEYGQTDYAKESL